ncbi:hypothetical protein HQ560_08940, partial [bacterium]|nr:hypothetical protein [bacterium]
MSTPDTPITLAHDRFGHWLHVTGIGLADVVRALPERFLSRALLVFDPEQLDYATSPLMQERRREGAAIEAYASELATHEDLAFWNSTEPLFENRACAVWPENTLAEMIRVQGRSGGMFGVCAIPTERVATLPDDFAYEHPSNVDAPLAFISMDDTATSVYVTEQEDVQILLSALVAKSLGMDDPSAPGVSDVAERLLPLAEADGIDIRPQLDEAGQPVSAIVSVGLWD